MRDADAPATFLATVAGSAGAYRVLSRLLSELPRSLDAAVIATLHAGPASALAESLQAGSSLEVRSPRAGDLLRPGRAYVPSGVHLIVNPDATLSVAPARRPRLFRPSADWLFESAGVSFRERHVAIVLSGMMWDGAATLPLVKREGGTVWVQDPAECAFPDMPRAAIASGCVDAVLPASGLAEALVGLVAARDRSADQASWESPFEFDAAC
jgi:two-component system chemotaxis response regulator CheB